MSERNQISSAASKPLSKPRLDFQSHEGLRGASAIWIMLFHIIVFSNIIPNHRLDFQGSSIMPLFFMLSGFSLAVAYGSSKYVLEDTCWKFFLIGRGATTSTNISTIFPDSEGSEDKPFNYNAFYRNRFARVLPLYYMCNILSIPLWIADYGSADLRNTPRTIIQAIMNFFGCTTLIGLIGSNYDGPSWTICTLLMFWYIFPKWAPYLQRMSDSELVIGIRRCYYIQIILVLIVFIPVVFVNYDLAFALSTMHPLTRFPLFLIGAYAGILCYRHHNQNLPWIRSFLWVFPGSLTADVEASNKIAEYWSRSCTQHSIFILFFTIIVTIIDILVQLYAGMGSILGQVWLQALVPFLQLQIIVGLTRDGGLSDVSKALRTKLAKWLGEISMTIYLVHWPLIYYLCWMIHGEFAQRQTRNCSEFASDTAERKACDQVSADYTDAITLAAWGIPIVAAATLVLSPLIYYFIEVPSRRFFRHK